MNPKSLMKTLWCRSGLYLFVFIPDDTIFLKGKVHRGSYLEVVNGDMYSVEGTKVGAQWIYVLEMRVGVRWVYYNILTINLSAKC